MFNKLKDSRFLDVETYDAVASTLSNFALPPEPLNKESVVELSRLMEALWLSLKFTQWNDPDRLLKTAETLGKAAIRILVLLLKSLPEIAAKLSSPGDLSKIERRLFILYIIHVSPIDFMNRSLKFNSIVDKLDKPLLTKLLAPFMIKAPLKEVKRIDEILLIAQEREILLTTEISPHLSKLMSHLHDHAVNDLQVHGHWINYFASTLNLDGLNKETLWNASSPKSGWSSYNTCILVLEVFSGAKDISELKESLMNAFVEWSRKALHALIDLLQEPTKDKAELVNGAYNAYMLPIFTFYGYLSKSNAKFGLIGTKLSIEIIERLMGSKLGSFLTQHNAESIFGSLYFLFSFMCKQVERNAVEGNAEFLEMKECNCVLLNLKLFMYIAKCIKESRKESVEELLKECKEEVEIKEEKQEEKEIYSKILELKEEDVNLNEQLKEMKSKLNRLKEAFKAKEESFKIRKRQVYKRREAEKEGEHRNKPQDDRKKPRAEVNEALESLEVVATTLGSLVSRAHSNVKPLINDWVANPEAVFFLFSIVDFSKKVKAGGVHGMVSKLIIEMTSKSACYTSAAWKSLVSAIPECLARNRKGFSCYFFAFLLKLSLCCYRSLERMSGDEVNEIISLWWNVVNSLILKDVEEKQRQNKELAILFLLQTILKKDNDTLFATNFIKIFSEEKAPSAEYYQLFIRITAALNAENEIMKVCSEALNSILLRGNAPNTRLIDFEEANAIEAFNKLMGLIQSKKLKGEMLELHNLVSLFESQSVAPLFNMVLSHPELIRFEEEDKRNSPNYYLQSLLKILNADPTNAVELLQENTFALVQIYMETGDLDNLPRLIYLQSILNCYILFAERLVDKKAAFSSSQDVLEFVYMAFERALDVVYHLIKNYYKALLNSKPELLPLADTLANFSILVPNLKETLDKLGLGDLYSPYFSKTKGVEGISEVLAAMRRSFGDSVQEPAKSCEAVAQVLETHFASKLPDPLALSDFSKAITSATLLIQSLIKLAIPLLKEGEVSTSCLGTLTLMKDLAMGEGDKPRLENVVGEVCKTVNGEMFAQLQMAIIGSIFLRRVNKALADLLQISSQIADKELLRKGIEVFLEAWEACGKDVDQIDAGVIVSAGEIAGYNFTEAVTSIVSLLESKDTTKEIFIQIIVAVYNIIARKPELVKILQTQLLKLTNDFTQTLLSAKEHNMHKIFSELVKDCPQLQQKLFAILTDILLTGQNKDLISHLDLLTQIVETSRARYVPALVEKLLPFVQTLGDNSLQATLLNYLASTCYLGMSVKFPAPAPVSHDSSESPDSLVEGYGVENYVKAADVGGLNICGSYMKGRRKSESQSCYYCYTCNLVDSKVCCSVCAKICHKGHKVIFVKNAQFNCSCQTEWECQVAPKGLSFGEGDSGLGSFISHYKKFPISARANEFIEDKLLMVSKHLAEAVPRQREVEIKLGEDEDEDVSSFSDEMVVEDRSHSEDSLAIFPASNKSEGQLSVSERSFDDKSPIHLPPRNIPYEKSCSGVPEIEAKCKLDKKEAEFALTNLASLCKLLLSTKASSLSKFFTEALSKERMKKSKCSSEKLLAVREKPILNSSTLAQLKQIYDLALSSSNSFRKHLQSIGSSSSSSFESYISLFPSARNSLARNNGDFIAIAYKDSLTIHNAAAIASDSSGSTRAYISEKRKILPLVKAAMNFVICSLHFNEANDSYLAVVGIKECEVLVLSGTGQVASRLKVDAMLEDMGDEYTITKAAWIPKSQVHLALAINSFVRVYDLASDNVSPIYVLNSPQGVIKDMCVTKNEELNFYRFFLVLNNSVATHALEIPPSNRSRPGDAEVHVVDMVEFPEHVKTCMSSTSVMSIYIGSVSNMLFLTFGNGRISYGNFDEESLSVKTMSMLRAADSGSVKYFFALEEVAVTEGELWLSGMSMAGQAQGVLIKVCEKESYYQMLRQKIESCFLFTNKKSLHRVLTLSEGYLGSFAPSISSGAGKNAQSLVKTTDYARFLEISQLPQTVSLPVDYFERAVNVINSSSLVKKVKIGGSIGLIVGNDTSALLEWLILGRGNNQLPVGAPSVSIEVTLGDSDYVMAGIRILAETAPRQFALLFNRRVPLGTVSKSVTEIPFCDAEILSIENNKLTFVLIAEETPIKLKGIEIYVFSKGDFGFEQKVENLALMIEKRLSTKSAEAGELASILSTNAYTIPPWSQKERLLNETIKGEDGLKAVISSLDFLSSVAYQSTPLPEETSTELLSALAPFIYLGAEGKAAVRAFETAVRKCAKAVVFNASQGRESVENDKFHYMTYKARALFERVREVLKESLPLESLENYLKSMASLVVKAKLCFFERMMENSNVLERLNKVLIEAIEKVIIGDTEADLKPKVKKVMEHYITIIMGFYDLLLNIEYRLNEGKLSPHRLIRQVHLEKISALVEPFLLSKTEEIKQAFTNVLIETLPKRDLEYMYTCQTPVVKKCKWNIFVAKGSAMDTDQPVEIEVRSFDFSFALGLILCNSFIKPLSENAKAHISSFTLLKELFCNYSAMGNYLRAVEEKSDEDWCALFRTFVESVLTKKSVANLPEREAIFIGVKLLNGLLPNPKGRDAKKGKTLELETGFKFLGSCYQHTNLIVWITTSLKSLFSSIKDSKESLEPMEDVPSKEGLLKVRPKFFKDVYQASFIGEQASERIELILFQELFKLCYCMASCEQTAVRAGMEARVLFKNSAEIEKLKDLLCEASITAGICSGLDSSAKSLLKMLYKSKNELNQYKDNFTYSMGYGMLKDFVGTGDSGYDVQVSVYNQLSAMWRVAKERTVFWKSYVKTVPDVIKMLFRVAGTLGSRITFQALALICLALENIDPDGFNIKTSYETLLQHPARTVDIIEAVKYAPIPCDRAGEGIPDAEIFNKGMEIGDGLIMDSASLRMRTVAAHLLKGLWDSGSPEQREQVFMLVTRKITPNVFQYGCATFQLLSLCLFIFQSEEASTGKYSEAVLRSIVEGSKHACNVIRTSELAEVYKEVQGMLALPGQDRENEGSSSRSEPFLYCLQEMPCSVCISDIGQEYSMQKVSDIKDETAFTGSSYIYKLSNSYAIQKIAVHLENNDMKCVKSLNLYSSPSKDSSLSALRENPSLWKKIGVLALRNRLRSGVLELPISVTTSLLKIEFIFVLPENTL